MRKIKLFTMLFVLTIVLLITFKVQAFQITDNQTVDANKKWTINFTGTVGYDDTTKQGIIITDSSGNKVNTTLELGSDNKSIIVDPPTGGYKAREAYTLIVGKQCHSSNGTQMKQDRAIHFSVKKTDVTISKIDNITVTVNQNDAYSLPGKVQATMSDNSTENVAITWDKSTIDTSKTGVFTFNGTVVGYNGNVILTVTVQSDISIFYNSIGSYNELIIKNIIKQFNPDTLSWNKNNLILAKYSSENKCNIQLSIYIILDDRKDVYNGKYYNYTHIVTTNFEYLTNDNRNSIISLVADLFPSEYQSSIPDQYNKMFNTSKMIYTTYENDINTTIANKGTKNFYKYDSPGGSFHQIYDVNNGIVSDVIDIAEIG